MPGATVRDPPQRAPTTRTSAPAPPGPRAAGGRPRPPTPTRGAGPPPAAPAAPPAPPLASAGQPAPWPEPVWLVRAVLVLFLIGFAAFLARELRTFLSSLP